MAQITINGKTYEAVFNFRAAWIYKEQTGKDMGEVEGLSDMLYMVYSCILAGEKKAGRVADITLDDVLDNVEFDDATALIEGLMPKKKKV